MTKKNQRFDSVWDAISDAPEEAENMKVRSALMDELQKYLRNSGLSQADAAPKLGVTQPRISDLTRGKIDRFSIDMLINMAARAGMRARLELRAA